MAWKKHCFISICLVGLLLAIFGFFFADYLDSLVQKKLAEKLPLVKDGEATEKWRSSSQAGIVRVYLFNITNIQELQAGEDVHPHLAEIGPFSYELRPKVHIMRWNDTDKHLAYRVSKEYHFLPELSPYPLSTVIHTVNVPLVSTITAIMQKVQSFIFMPFVKSTLNYQIKKYDEKVFINRTADELLFKGFKVPMVENLLNQISMVTKVDVPHNGTFGFFYNKNHTDNGELLIDTGIVNIKNIGQVAVWNNKTSLECWPLEQCRSIRGTDGLRFSPGLHPSFNSSLAIFVPNLHRPIKMDYIKTSVLHKINVFRYESSRENFLHENERACYCPDPNKLIANYSICQFEGLQDVSVCADNKPLVISMPHFLHASPELQNLYEGLKPDFAKHQPFIQVDPVTGIVLGGARRMQVNMHLHSFEGVNEFGDLRNLLVPLIWMEEATEISQDKAEVYYDTIHFKPKMLFYFSMVVILIGFLMFTVGALVFLYEKKQKLKKKRQNANDDAQHKEEMKSFR